MEATLAAIQPYEIHGTRYYRFAYTLDDNPGHYLEGRVAAESMYRDAAAGDRVEIQMLLGVINEVTKVAP